MSQSQTGKWSVVALISCRQTMSGCSRSMNSCTCAWRARIPFTFHVATFIRSVDCTSRPRTHVASASVDGVARRGRALLLKGDRGRRSVPATGAVWRVGGGGMNRELGNLGAGAMGAIAERRLPFVEQRDHLSVVGLVDASRAPTGKEPAGEAPENTDETCLGNGAAPEV